MRYSLSFFSHVLCGPVVEEIVVVRIVDAAADTVEIERIGNSLLTCLNMTSIMAVRLFELTIIQGYSLNYVI